MKKNNRKATQLFNFINLKYNKLAGRNEQQLFLVQTISIINKDDNTFSSQKEYIQHISNKSSLSITYITTKLREIVKSKQGYWNLKEKKFILNSNAFTPKKEVERLAVINKKERCEKFGQKFNEKTATSDSFNQVYVSEHFYKVMEENNLTLRQTLLLFFIASNRKSFANGKCSLQYIADVMCIGMSSLTADYKVLTERKLITFISGQKSRTNNRIYIKKAIVDTIITSKEDMCKKYKRTRITPHVKQWLYKNWMHKGFRQVIGGDVSFDFYDYKKRNTINLSDIDLNRFNTPYSPLEIG